MAREFVSVSPGFHEDELRRKGKLEKSEFWGSILMGATGLLFRLEFKSAVGERE